eukprot:s666_g3.t1
MDRCIADAPPMKDQREVHPSIMQAIMKLVQVLQSELRAALEARDRAKLSAGLEMLRYAKVAQLPEEEAATRTLVSLELEEAIQNRSELELKQDHSIPVSSVSIGTINEAIIEQLLEGHLSVVGRYHRLPARLEDDYNVEKKALGTGYNGSVLLARGKTRIGKFAVKAFKLHGVSKEKKQELASEAEIFLSMDHPHVVRLFDVYEEEDRLSLVMECMEGGELFDRVREKKVYSEKDRIVMATRHLEQKLENFLYENKNSDFLKLIDFGFSKVWAKNTKMELSCGTLSYAAPEVLAKSYTSQCDLWSLGVIVFILLVGYMPFAGSDERKQIHMIRSGTYLVKKERWAKVSSLASDFVKKLLVVDPDVRMTAPQALEHPWIKNHEDACSDCIDEAMVASLCDFAKSQSFRRSCMKLMAWSLTAPERAQVRDAFMALDTGSTGTIRISDLKQILEENFHLPEEEQQHVFNAFSDSDACLEFTQSLRYVSSSKKLLPRKSLLMSGEQTRSLGLKSADNCGHPQPKDDDIQYSEFLAAMMASRIALHDELLKDAFRRFDTENSGYIRREDLFKVLESESEALQVMKELDVNQDGKISYEEFIGYLKNGSAADNDLEAAERAISREIICRHRNDGSEPKLRKRDKLKGMFQLGINDLDKSSAAGALRFLVDRTAILSAHQYNHRSARLYKDAVDTLQQVLEEKRVEQMARQLSDAAARGDLETLHGLLQGSHSSQAGVSLASRPEFAEAEAALKKGVRQSLQRAAASCSRRQVRQACAEALRYGFSELPEYQRLVDLQRQLCLQNLQDAAQQRHEEQIREKLQEFIEEPELLDWGRKDPATETFKGPAGYSSVCHVLYCWNMLEVEHVFELILIDEVNSRYGCEAICVIPVSPRRHMRSHFA